MLATLSTVSSRSQSIRSARRSLALRTIKSGNEIVAGAVRSLNGYMRYLKNAKTDNE